MFGGCFVAAVTVQALGREAFIIDPVFYIVSVLVGLVPFFFVASYTRRTLVVAGAKRIRVFEHGVEFTYGQDGRVVRKSCAFEDVKDLYFGEKSSTKRTARRVLGGRSVSAVDQTRLTAEISDGAIVRYDGATLTSDSDDLCKLLKHWRRRKASSAPS